MDSLGQGLKLFQEKLEKYQKVCSELQDKQHSVQVCRELWEEVWHEGWNDRI